MHDMLQKGLCSLFFLGIMQVPVNKPGHEGAAANYEVGVEGSSLFPVDLVPFKYLFSAS